MLVETADAGILEQHATTSVGLKAVFVRVNDDGIDLRKQVVDAACFGGQVIGQSEVAAISRIGVDTETILLAEFEQFGQGID